jgi:putative ABC transport system permease protein
MLRRFWLKLTRRRNLERDLEAELAFHREMAHAAGNDRPFDNRTFIEEQARELWRFTLIENLLRDARFGMRRILRDPVLLVGGVVSLGLGIGANTALFSLGTSFLLSEPSVTDAARIVNVHLGGTSHPELRVIDHLRESNTFAAVAGLNTASYTNWSSGGATRRIYAATTTVNFFTAMGVPVAMGHGYSESDRGEVAVLADSFWRARLNADPGVVGRALFFDGKPHTVVGVLPPDHRTLTGFGIVPDVYLPVTDPGAPLEIYARLKPEQQMENAAAALNVFAARLDALAFDPERTFAGSASVHTIAGFARLAEVSELQVVSVFFAILLAVAGMVLLIACVNVAGLLLARDATRQREMAIRSSIGAGRARIVQQLLVESSLLAALGTAAGLLIARFAAVALERLPVPLPVPVRIAVALDWRVAIYASVLAVITILAVGLLPALKTARESAAAPRLARHSRQRLRKTLVTVQVAVAVVVLLTGFLFLFLRNLLRSASADPGFDLEHTIRAQAFLPQQSTASAERVQRTLRAIEGLPGVEAVAAAHYLPFTDSSTRGSEVVFAETGERKYISVSWNSVTADYFRAMAIPMIAGATWDAAAGGATPVVVNRTFVERHFGNRSAVGAKFTWRGEPYRISGVVEGTRILTLGEDPEPQMFEPLVDAGTQVQLVIRTAGSPASMAATVRRALQDAEPEAGIEVEPLRPAIALAFFPSQVGAALMGSIGLLGLCLAGVGIYGTLSYSVVRRAQELAVRKAIGATGASLACLVLIESAQLIGVGSAIGLLAAWLVTKPLAMFFVAGIRPSDPVNFAAVAGVFAALGIIAALGPARRAAAADPADAIRNG